MTKRVICKSGLVGWQCKLQENYTNYQEFLQYDSIYNIHLALGYKTAKGCWMSNPTVQGSVDPSDYRRVK